MSIVVVEKNLDEKISFQLVQKFKQLISNVRHGIITPSLAIKYGNALTFWLQSNACESVFNGIAFYHHCQILAVKYKKEMLLKISPDYSLAYLVCHLNLVVKIPFPDTIKIDSLVNVSIWMKALESTILLQEKSDWRLPSLTRLKKLHENYKNMYYFLREAPSIWDSLFEEYIEILDKIINTFDENKNVIYQNNDLALSLASDNIQVLEDAQFNALKQKKKICIELAENENIIELFQHLEIAKQLIKLFASHFGCAQEKLEKIDQILLGEAQIMQILTNYQQVTEYHYPFPGVSLFVWKDKINQLKIQSLTAEKPIKSLIEDIIELHVNQLHLQNSNFTQEKTYVNNPRNRNVN